MKIGITLYGNQPGEMVPITQYAEALGFDSVWLGEHVVAPEVMAEEHPYSTAAPMALSGDERMYDLWVAIGAIIGGTSKIKVASGICLLSLRHPLLTARACLSAHNMSGGRFKFGVAVGWLASEFQALGIPFTERSKRFDEILDILPRLFSGEGPVAHDGPFYPFPALQITRVPARIPLLIGGTKPIAVRRAALRGDGWYGTTIPLEECLRIKTAIERIREENGMDKKPFECVARPVGPATNENLDPYWAAGFTTLVLPWETVVQDEPANVSLSSKLRSLEKVAKRVGLKP